MNRPEGISESAWTAAAEPAKRILAGEDFATIEAFERVLFAAQCTIALAIQSSVEAERERAAQLAEAYPFRRWEQHEPDKSVYGWGRCRTEIAQAIRKGA